MHTCVVCVCVVISFILDVRFVDVPAGVPQGEGHTGFFIHLPSAVLAFLFIATRIQPFLSIVYREVEFLCTHKFIVLHLLGIIFLFLSFFVSENPRSCDCTEIRTHVPTSEGLRGRGIV